MSTRPQSDPFWQQSFFAALTGLTMAGASQLHVLAATSPAQDPDPPPPPDETALATRPEETSPAPLDLYGGMAPAEFAASDPDDPAFQLHVSEYHEAIVQEAAAIANAAWMMTRKPAPLRKRGPDEPDNGAGRRAANTIGSVKVYKAR